MKMGKKILVIMLGVFMLFSGTQGLFIGAEDTETPTTNVKENEEDIVSAQANIVDSSMLSLTYLDNTTATQIFYCDAAAPNNVKHLMLNINNAETGDVVTVNLKDLTLNANPVINGATVTQAVVSGERILKITFTQDQSVNIPLDIKAGYTSNQKTLTGVQNAIDSGAVPGLKTINVIDTKKNGTVYESSLDVDVELMDYSLPTNVGFFVGATSINTNAIQGNEYTFSVILGSFWEEDGKKHPGFNRYANSVDVTIKMPGDFVLTGGDGWTQSGDMITYTGNTGDPAFQAPTIPAITGKFMAAPGTYTVIGGTATAYFGYDNTPYTVTQTEDTLPVNAQTKVTIVTPTTIPELTAEYGTWLGHIYRIDEELRHGRTNEDKDLMPIYYFETNDPCITDSGDRTFSSVHWEIAIPEGPILSGFTVPDLATGITITFKDGTTKTYAPGEVVTLTDPKNNPATLIATDFGSLPTYEKIPLPLIFDHDDCDLDATQTWLLPQTLTGTLSDGSILPTQANGGYGWNGNYSKVTWNVYHEFVTRGALVTSATTAVPLQYGDPNIKKQGTNTWGSTSSPSVYGENFTFQMYEPILYYVLPLGVNYKGVTGGVEGYEVSTWTISTGQTVVKIDYTGTGKMLSTTNTAAADDWPVATYQTKAWGLPLQSNIYSFISNVNDPAISIHDGSSLAGIYKPTDSEFNEMTQGDANAVLVDYYPAINQIITIDGTKYLMGGTTISNNQGITGTSAVSDIVYGDDHNLNISLVNTTPADAGMLQALTDLPSAGLTLQLSGPGTLIDVSTGEPITDESIGKILYSTTEQTIAEGQPINETGYVTADEVTDWSKIKSFIIHVDNMETNSEFNAIMPLVAPKALDELDTPVTITTKVISNDLEATSSVTDEFISSILIVQGTLHYDANTGNTSSVPANQTTEKFLEIDTTNHSVIVSNTIPTKNADIYKTYTFKDWTTSPDGSGDVYEPGDTITNIAGGSMVTLYARWTETPIPPVEAIVQYDANTGNATSVPDSVTLSFQPSQTGFMTLSSTIPTKDADAYFTYSFSGWNTQADGKGTSYAAGSAISNLAGGSTTTLYAQWNKAAIAPVSATLHYNANTGNTSSVPTDQTTSFQPSQTGSITVSNTLPTKNADAYKTYTFKEWNTKEDGSGDTYEAGDTITNIAGGSTVTLYAIWTETSIPPVEAIVQYDANTGNATSVPDSVTLLFQPSQTGFMSLSSTIPTKDADAYFTYSFSGWNTQADGKGTSYTAGSAISNLAGGSTTTLYAQWNKAAIAPVSATLQYNANTGNTSSVPTDQTTSFQPSETGSLTVSDTIPTKSADAYYTYTFKEWNTQADGEGTVYEAGDEINNLNGGDSVTLYAIWTAEEIEAVPVTVHYDANSGDTESVPEDDVDYFQPSLIGTPIVSSIIPTKEADAYYTYTFKEWNTQADGKGTAYVAGDGVEGLTANSTITLYAIWNQTAIPAVNATLQYDANSGNTSSLPTNTTVSFQPSETGSITVSGTIPTKAEDDTYTYSFKEWNTQADGEGTVYEAGDVFTELEGGSTITIYAIWESHIKSTSVITHYVDVDGNTIAPDVITTATIGSAYTTEGLSGEALVNGEITYILIETPSNASGEYTTTNIEVTYVYKVIKKPVDPEKNVTMEEREYPKDADGVSTGDDTNIATLVITMLGILGIMSVLKVKKEDE